MLSRFSR